MRVGNRPSACALALAVLWACGGAVHAAAPEGRGPIIQVTGVAATGRGTPSQFDPRIPKAVRAQIEGGNLGYGRYDLVASDRKPTTFGSEALFPLPDNEALGIRPFAPPAPAAPLRLDARILDADQRPILASQLRVRYGATFLLHRPKGDAALILGVSAHPPK